MKKFGKDGLEELSIPVWWGVGTGRILRRSCLPADHPEQTYNYMVREFGVNPEDYGIEKPVNHFETCPNCDCKF